MFPDILSGLAASGTTAPAIFSLKKALDQYLTVKKIKVEAVTKEELVAEILKKADEIRGEESNEEASRSTREVIEKQATIIEEERNRLLSIATREHWVGLFFAIFAGIVFLTAIIVAIKGTVQQAVITLIASAVPGFLSKVFFSREATIETRIKEISADIRESEKIKERLELLEEALKVVPAESQNKLTEEFIKKAFRK